MKHIKNLGDIYDILETIEDQGDKWHRDGLPPPSSKVLRDAADVCRKLINDHGILPKHIVQTVEEGLFLRFENGHEVILEMYNEGDAAILIRSRDGEMLDSIDIPAFGRNGVICQLIPKILKTS